MNGERYQQAWSQISRYEVIAEIGRGGMGVVYRAYEAALDRTIALKVLAPELANQPGFVARLRREAISAARLRHPNIALLFEFGQADDTAFLAQLAQFSSLEQLQQMNQSLTTISQFYTALGTGSAAGDSVAGAVADAVGAGVPVDVTARLPRIIAPAQPEKIDP